MCLIIRYMSVNGKMANRMAMVESNTQVVELTSVNYVWEKGMGKGHIHMLTEEKILVNGKMETESIKVQ